MKNYIFRVCAFLLLLVSEDYLIGLSFDYLGKHPKGGETARLNYICKETNEDILIVGSSRALHHYVPQVIEDSLNLSVFNCGVEGNGIILFYMQLCDILDHYTPKNIIYDIEPSFDLSTKDDNTRFLGTERRFYGKPEIDSVFWNIDSKERYKMMSSAYRYNSNFLGIISDFIRPRSENNKGYRPLYGKLNPNKVTKVSEYNIEIDSLKLAYMEKYVQKCKSHGVNLIFMASPQYRKCPDTFEEIRKISSKYNIPFINHYQSLAFLENDSCFNDVAHLNNIGADLYTKMIVADLKQVCN